MAAESTEKSSKILEKKPELLNLGYRTNWMYGVDSGVICDGIGSEQRC